MVERRPNPRVKMFRFITKMKNLKRKIIEWNKEHFKNIFETKLEIEEELKNLNNEVIKKGMDNCKYMKEKELMTKQEDILAKEETFWRQKSREKWLEEGDRNTKFFHNSVIQNKNLRNITHLKSVEGNMVSDPLKISEELINYFNDCLNNYETSNHSSQLEILQNIPKIISDEDNKLLNKPLTLEEIKSALFSINPDKSPGPDGFQAFFYQKCWDIIGEELWVAIEATRNGGSILKEINHTFLTLIPKKGNAEVPGDYRPIALCNTIYKILSKALATRLKTLLPKLISEEQTRFMPGKSIIDGISIIQETIHSAKSNKEACMFLKLDIQKAYDKVDWRFLCKTMEAFGFSRRWINLIYQCISTPKFSLLINGTPEGFFSTSKGIRQGDPISPFLFIIMAETLGRSIKFAQSQSKIQGIPVADNVENTTHQQFADDTILAGQSTTYETKNYKTILDK